MGTHVPAMVFPAVWNGVDFLERSDTLHAGHAQARTRSAAPVPSRRRGAVLMLAGGYANLALLTVQGLVLVPLYLRYVGSELYGAWLASGDLLGWLALLDMGVAGVVTQRMAAAHGRGERAELGEYYATGLAVQAVLVAVLTALAAAAAPFIPGWLGIHGPDARLLSACFAVAGIATGVGILATLVASLPLAVQRMGFYTAASLASTLAGLVVTLWGLLSGAGLWALVWGMLARSGLLLLSVGAYAAGVLRHEGARLRVRMPVLRELGSLGGATFLSMLGNTAVGRCDALLVAVVFRPELATVYVLTRRAAEIIAMFLARVGGAVFPGFAHLVGAGQLPRARQVLAQVDRGYLAVASLALALYMALNRTFMELWVGPAQYGGHLLTVLIALNVLLVGRAAVIVYLLGGAGDIRRSAHVIFAEAVVRVGATLALLYLLGVRGVPVAGIVTTIVSAQVAMGMLARRLQAPPAERRWRIGSGWPAYALLLAAGALAGRGRWAHSWAGFAGWSALLGAAGLALLLALDPAARAFAVGRLRALRPARGAAS
jgi:O-antigen/teichoic acid export membrane protein